MTYNSVSTKRTCGKICRAASKIVGPKAAGSVVTLSFILLWCVPFPSPALMQGRSGGAQEALWRVPGVGKKLSEDLKAGKICVRVPAMDWQ